MPTLLLGITSGIAAFKMVELAQLLVDAGVTVQTMLTSNAGQMIDVDQLQKITGKAPLTALYPANFDYKNILQTREVEHIQVADSADLLVIAPATANTLAKLAQGLADDFLSTTTLAVTCPVLIFPSMNVHMWQHPSVQKNVQTVRSFGYIIIDPDSGPLACGYDGKGRLPDVRTIFDVIQQSLQKTALLQKKKVLITYGGTQEKIDAVRFISNLSSGKMGAALAEACAQAGAEVTILRAQNSVEARMIAKKSESFVSADELEQLLQREVPLHDVLFHVAAVSDFSITQNKGASQKLSSDAVTTLELQPRKKILDQIKTWNPNIMLVAFKAEAGISQEKLVQKAQKRLIQSGADVIIANEVGKSDRGFQSENNAVTIIKNDLSISHIPLASKTEIAKKIVETLFS